MMLRFKKHRTFITATILSLLLILAGGFVFSQSGTRYLEIDYPIIDGESPTSTKTFLHTYIKYIFNLAIIVCGLITLAVIVRAGAQYTASRGNPSSLRDARDRIVCGIVGLLILLSSYVILSTINPKLVVFNFNPLTSTTIIPDSIPIISMEATSTAYELPLGVLINNESSLTASSYSTYEGILSPDRLERFEKTATTTKAAIIKLEELTKVLRDESLKLKDWGLLLQTQCLELANHAADCKCSNCTSTCHIGWPADNKCPWCTNDGCWQMSPCSSCGLYGLDDTCPNRIRIDELRNPFNIIDGIDEIIASTTDQKLVVEEESKKVKLFSQVIEAFLSKTDTVEAFMTTPAYLTDSLLFSAATKNLISKADRTGLKEIEQDYGNPQEIKERLLEDLVSLEELELTIKQNSLEITSYYSLLESKDLKYEISQYRSGDIDPGMDPATFYHIVK